jgi:topoisomerase IA-like protein
MATLANLKKSISQMTAEEALSLVLERRQSRRTPKDPPKKSKKTGATRESKKKPPSVSVEQLFASLNSEQQKEFLAKLEAKTHG